MNQSKLGIAIVVVAVVIGGGFLLMTKAKPVDTALAQELKVTYDSIPTAAGKANFMTQSNNMTMAVDPELADLDKQIITCSPNVDSLMGSSPTTGGSCTAGPTMLASTTGLTLGGQCCGALKDTKEYHENLQKLQAYKSMPDIILDPMHTPIELAKKWIDYDKATTLTPEEQKVFDQAYAISKEKPCCCKCWHYFVNEGIAKKMIKDGTFNAQQIADYWDASSICGA